MLNYFKSLFLVGALIAQFLITPGKVEASNQTYIGVFTSWDFDESNFDPFFVNVLVKSKSWANFDKFLDIVAEKTGYGQPVLIELNVHGLDALSVQTKDGSVSEDASFGYIVNHIEDRLKNRQVTVLCEACYGGFVYKQTIRGNIHSGTYFENCDHVPQFPIIGSSGNLIGRSTLVYQEWITNQHFFWKDLRDFERECPLPIQLDEKNPDNKRLEAASDYLSSLFNYRSTKYKKIDLNGRK